MVPTLDYIRQKFHEFNHLYFQDKLAPIPIKLSNTKSYVGNISFKRRRKFFGQWEYYDFTMRINTRIALSEQELEDTILHEMIHYYLYANQLQDKTPHGPHFRQMMQYFNDTYGRHITISHKGAKVEWKQDENSKPKKHIFAILTHKSGRKYVKVVPRIRSRVLYFHNSMFKSGEIIEIKWYYSTDPYFNRFPSSVSMRVYEFEEAEMLPRIKEAQPLYCDDKNVIDTR